MSINWSLAFGFTVVLLLMAVFRLRADRKRVRVVDAFITWPGAIGLLIYAWFYSHWLELLIAAAVSGLIVTVWWVTYGRYLPPPTSDNITVWEQEPKKPTATPAETQAEVERLKKEKEELEKELEKVLRERGPEAERKADDVG